MTNILVASFALLSAVFCAAVNAQTKYPIEVVDTMQDSTGQQLVYLLKEQIRRASILRLTSTDEPRMQIRIQSIALTGTSEMATVYSVVWTLDGKEGQVLPYFLDSTYGYSGSARLEETARRLVARTDKLFSSFGLNGSAE